MLVLGDPRALQRVDGRIEIVDELRRGVSRFQRGGVHERLECGPRLPLRLRRAVEPAVEKSRPPTMARTSPVQDRARRAPPAADPQKLLAVRGSATGALPLDLAERSLTAFSAARCIAGSMVV